MLNQRWQADLGLLYTRNESARFDPHVIGILQQCARQTGRRLALFPIHDVDVERGRVVGTWIDGQRVVHEQEQAIPPVLFNLSLYRQASGIRTLRRLRLSPHYRVFNPLNRFAQSTVFERLALHESLAQWIPPLVTHSRPQTDERWMLQVDKGRGQWNPVWVEEENGLVVIRAGQMRQYCHPKQVERRLELLFGGRTRYGLALPRSFAAEARPRRVYLMATAHTGRSRWDVVGSLQAWPLQPGLQRASQAVAQELDWHLPHLAALTLDWLEPTDGSGGQDAEPQLMQVSGVEQSNTYYDQHPDAWVALLQRAVAYCAQEDADEAEGRGSG